jgi:hypothetical protein
MATPAEPGAKEATEPKIVLGSREQLLHLLAEAAEIEHTLMCSYLYAVFSLKRAGEEGVGAAHGEALERWRKRILNVAAEEMGHLVPAAFRAPQLPGCPRLFSVRRRGPPDRVRR